MYSIAIPPTFIHQQQQQKYVMDGALKNPHEDVVENFKNAYGMGETFCACQNCHYDLTTRGSVFVKKRTKITIPTNQK